MVLNKKNLFFSIGLLAALVLAPGRQVFAGDPSLDDLPPNLKKVGDLKPTFYWVALETNDGLPKENPLLDINGDVIAKVSAKFLAGIRMEGTGRLLDGRIVNFHVRTNGEIRWRVCPPSAPYGYGLENYVLKPFRSVAVDPNVVPIPSRVYIPAAKGIPLPDGSVHDGYFEAVDIGEAIQNQRIDVFTAMGDQSAVFERHGLTNMKATAVYLVTE
jgi:3D (Asp-Asp-Asp) domain-containing protein